MTYQGLFQSAFFFLPPTGQKLLDAALKKRPLQPLSRQGCKNTFKSGLKHVKKQAA